MKWRKLLAIKNQWNAGIHYDEVGWSGMSDKTAQKLVVVSQNKMLESALVELTDQTFTLKVRTTLNTHNFWFLMATGDHEYLMLSSLVPNMQNLMFFELLNQELSYV